MTVIVLDFTIGRLDFVEYDPEFVDEFYDGDVESFLVCWCGYPASSIQFMVVDEEFEERRNLDINSFDGDDDLGLSDEDKQRYNIKTK